MNTAAGRKAVDHLVSAVVPHIVSTAHGHDSHTEKGLTVEVAWFSQADTYVLSLTARKGTKTVEGETSVPVGAADSSAAAASAALKASLTSELRGLAAAL